MTKLLKSLEISLVFLCLIQGAALAKPLDNSVQLDDNLLSPESSPEKPENIDLDIANFAEPAAPVYEAGEFPLLNVNFSTEAAALLPDSIAPTTNTTTNPTSKDVEVVAQDSGESGSGFPGEFSGFISLTTDYMLRGISQTDNDFALQGGITYSIPLDEKLGFYAGFFSSTVDFNDGDEAQLELDPSVGFTYQATDALSFELSGLYYTYPNADSSLNYNFFEALAAVRYNAGAVGLGTLVYYSPDYFGGNDEGVYVQATVDVPVSDSFYLTGWVGHQSVSDNSNFGVPDYYDWSVGAGYSIAGVNLLLQYVDSNLSRSDCFGGSDLCDARAVFTISK
jgi:uncharacterized protein (TIGR02001 family)